MVVNMELKRRFAGLLPVETAPRRHVSHSVLYFLSRAAPGALTALTVPVFIRVIGAAEYGRFSLIYSLILAVAGFATQLVAQPVLRYQGKFGGGLRAAFRREVRRYTVLSSAGGTVCLLAVSPWFFPGSARMLAAAAAVVIGQITYGVAAAEVQAALAVGRFAWAEAIRSGSTICGSLVAVLAFRNHGIVDLLLGNVVGSAIGWFVLLKLRTRPGEPAPPSGDHRVARLVLSYGWPMALWALISVLLNLSDRFIIARMSGLTDAGVYSAAYDVVYRGVGILLTPIVLATHPLAMSAWNAGQPQQAAGVLWKGMRLQLTAGTVVLAACVVLAPSITRFTTGQGDSATRVVAPIAAGAVLWQVAMLAHKPMELANKTLSMAVFGFCALAINVGLNLWLVPRYGYVAAAYTTAAGAFVYLAMCVAWLQGATGQRIVAALSARAAVAAGPAGLG